MLSGVSFREVTRLVRRSRRKLRVFRLLETGSALLALALVLWLAAPLAEAAIPFFPYAGPVYVLICVLVLVYLGARLAREVFRPLPREKVAFYLEREHPALRHLVLNALQLQQEVVQGENRAHASVDLAQAAIEQAARAIAEEPDLSLRFPKVVLHRLYLLLPLGAAFLGSWLLFPSGVQRTYALLVNPFQSVPPRHISITLQPGNIKIPRGDSLEIVATTRGPLPRQVSLLTEDGNGARRVLVMSAAGPARFHAVLPHVSSSFRYRARAGSDLSPLYRVEAVDLPVAGNFRFRYIYPEYTGLPPQVRQGDGQVEVLKGTEVVLQTQANKKIARADMVFDDGSRRPMQVSRGTSLGVRVVALSQTGYHLELEDFEGFKNRDPVHYDFRVLPDDPPTVQILSPPPQATVDEYQVVDVAFTAADDFGLSSIALVYRRGEGPEHRIRLDEPRKREKKVSGHYLWDLGLLSLKPGTVLRYHLEVRDNDAISGPKTGVSAEQVLIVHSAQERHRSVQELQRTLRSKLMDLLADQLQEQDKTEQLREGKPAADSQRRASQLQAGDRRLQDRLGEVVDLLNEGMQRMEKDPLSDVSTVMDLDTLKRNLEFLQDQLRKSRPPVDSKAFADRQEEITSELEKASLLAEDTLQRQKMRDLMASTQNITNMQRGIMDTLDQLARKSDPRLMRSLMDTLGKLQNLMQRMMQSLSQLARQMPDEFLNQMNTRTLDFGQVFKQLQEMQRLLQKGDIEGARQLAQKLMESLSQMMASLQGAFNMAQNSPFDMSQREGQKASNVLQELIEGEKGILKDTEGLDGRLSDLLNQRQKDDFPKLEQNLKDTVNTVNDQLQKVGGQSRPGTDGADWNLRLSLDRLRDTLSRMAREIKDRRLEEGKRLLHEAREEQAALARELRARETDDKVAPDQRARADKSLDGVGDALSSLEKELQALPDQSRQVVGPTEADKFRELSGRQGALQDKTSALLNKLRELSFLTPFLGPELLNGLEGAAGAMGMAKTQLGGQASGEAIPPEREAINRLSQAQSNLQSAMQQMAQRGRMMGTPAPMLSQAGVSPYYFRGLGQPPLGQPERSFQEQGRQGISEREFQLPGREAYRTPEIFRQEVLKSLKDKVPPAYKGKVEKYFEKLTE